MRAMMRWRILITSLVLIIGMGVYYYANTRTTDPFEVVALIKKNINPKDGSIMDYAGDINFRGPESVGYEILNEEDIRIYFGDLQFDMKKDDLLNKELIANLKAIGIEIVQSKKTHKFVVKYKGEPVSLYGEKK